MIKGKVKAKKDNNERWLLTYSDLITLLMVFFVMMYATANTDVKKFSQLAASMQKAFNVGVLQGQVDNAVIDQGGPDISPTTLGVSDSEFYRISQQMFDFAKLEGLTDNIEVTRSDEGVIIRLSDRAIFASGRAELGFQAKKTLNQVAAILRQYSNQVRVEGHTDDVPTNNPDYPTNWDLSSARAISVVKFFIDEGHIDPTRLSAAGYGEFRPVVPNDSPENRAKNRRCDILIIYPQD